MLIDFIMSIIFGFTEYIFDSLCFFPKRINLAISFGILTRIITSRTVINSFKSIKNDRVILIQIGFQFLATAKGVDLLGEAMMEGGRDLALAEGDAFL